MSRPQEVRVEYLKTDAYIVNFALKTNGDYTLHQIVDSLKGIEGN